MILDWYTVTMTALQDLWRWFLGFIPNLFGAIIIFGIGWFISAGIGKLVAGILTKLKFNAIFERGSWKSALERANFKVNAAEFIGVLFKWVFAILFLMVAVEILGLTEFTYFLQNVLGYLDNVIIAALILVVAVVVIDLVSKVVVAAAEGSKFSRAYIAGEVVKIALWIFAILAILRQLLVAPELVDILFSAIVYGVIAFLVISLGLSFGLGGKDTAAEILADVKRKLKG